MKTTPIYLDDPYVKEMKAKIIDAIQEKEGVWRLILDETIFYPMGGGQPTDQGQIIFSDGSRAEVYQALLKDGEINHYVKTSSQPVLGSEVRGIIDWERRYKNMRVHSAGHVIDFSMYLLGYSPSPLHPMKGDHGKKPFVLYQGAIEKEIKDELQKKSNELIAKDFNFSWNFDLLENIEKEAIYLQPGLPKNKPLRALRLDGVGVVADGGTIVASTKEVGNVLITDIEVDDGNTCIKYQVV
ncbi:alanyl-tRNA synthetase [Candidatus Rubidus massiliensis]|nr:alanyl-tRNA synthetase [Candidatus Rubidus massiliensis]